MAFVAAADSRVTALLVALGIDPGKTCRVTIEFNVNDVVVTVVEQFATTDDLAALTEMVKQFHLVPIEPATGGPGESSATVLVHAGETIQP